MSQNLSKFALITFAQYCMNPLFVVLIFFSSEILSSSGSTKMEQSCAYLGMHAVCFGLPGVLMLTWEMFKPL